jgi:hypothetical protein
MVTRALLAASVLASIATSAHAAGAFATVPTADGEACARVCADDGLCMAWRFEDGACALRATVSADPVAGQSGLSHRALEAGFLPPPKPAVGEAPETVAAKGEPSAVTGSTSAADALLGGPESLELALNADSEK